MVDIWGLWIPEGRTTSQHQGRRRALNEMPFVTARIPVHMRVIANHPACPMPKHLIHLDSLGPCRIRLELLLYCQLC